MPPRKQSAASRDAAGEQAPGGIGARQAKGTLSPKLVGDRVQEVGFAVVERRDDLVVGVMTQTGKVVKVRVGVERREHHERSVRTGSGRLRVTRSDGIKHQLALLRNTARHQGGGDQEAGSNNWFHIPAFFPVSLPRNDSEWNLMWRSAAFNEDRLESKREGSPERRLCTPDELVLGFLRC